MGPGMSMGLAEKFGKEGFKVGMISRTESKLQGFVEALRQKGIMSDYAVADVSDTSQLLSALRSLKKRLGRIDVLEYNAVDARYVNIMDEDVDDLVKGFRISVGNAYAAVMELLPELRQTKGAVLLTGGGTATLPNPDFASISLGKAGIRNLAYQLNRTLKEQGVFVGTVTVGGWIQHESETHSPEILAEKFWSLYQSRDEVELVY
jgi:short-subunit dehydrogenase